MQAANQAATVKVRPLKEADTGPATGPNTANTWQEHRPRHDGPALRQPVFDWKTSDNYTELLNYEM